MLTLTHAASSLKMRVNPAHIAALVPRAALSGDIPDPAKCAVVLSTGTQFYFVTETVAVVAALIDGVELEVVGDD